MERPAPPAVKPPPQVLEAALMLACERIADGPQRYEEANTADGWARIFIAAAEGGKPVGDVLGASPVPEVMTEAERRAFGQNLT